MASRKGSGARDFFRRCVRRLEDAARRSDQIINAEKLCGAALREPRKRRRPRRSR